MDSLLEVVAIASGDRRPCVLHSVRSTGHHLAARSTGPGVLHLVGTAAGPMDGDRVTIRLSVGPGARLRVRSAAATIALPAWRRAEAGPSRLRVEIDVADGAELDLAPEPVVVAASATLHTTTTVRAQGSARVRVLEEVRLGRHGERPGTWRGRTRVLRDGVPVLSHTLTSQLLAVDGLRAVSSLLELPDEDGDGRPEPRLHPGVQQVVCRLPGGGLLSTALTSPVDGQVKSCTRCPCTARRT